METSHAHIAWESYLWSVYLPNVSLQIMSEVRNVSNS